jgi:hypothetical protein
MFLSHKGGHWLAKMLYSSETGMLPNISIDNGLHVVQLSDYLGRGKTAVVYAGDLMGSVP